MERDPKAKLLHKDMRDQRRREQPAFEKLLRLRRRNDHSSRFPTVLVELLFDVAAIRVRARLVLHACDHYPDRTSASIRVPAAFLEADPFRFPFHRRIRDLDALLRHPLLGQIASTAPTR